MLIVSAFAALILSVHTSHASTATLAVQRVQADAAAQAALHLALWRPAHDPDWRAAVASAVLAGDTSWSAEPLIHAAGTLNGAAFSVDAWPGATTIRLRARAACAGVHAERGTAAPLAFED